MFRLIVASQCSKVSYVCVTTIYVGTLTTLFFLIFPLMISLFIA